MKKFYSLRKLANLDNPESSRRDFFFCSKLTRESTGVFAFPSSHLHRHLFVFSHVRHVDLVVDETSVGVCLLLFR